MNQYHGMSIDALCTKARELCNPQRTDQRKIAMALVLKVETQEAYLEEIFNLVRCIDIDDPQFETLRKVQALAYQGAHIWQKSSNG